MKSVVSMALMALVVGAGSMVTAQSTQPPTPAQALTRQFASLNERLLDMARDFPADKYSYRPTPDVRTFGEVIVHVLSGNVYAAKAVHDPKANWDELDPKAYKTKEEVVHALEQSITNATAALKTVAPSALAQTPEPWLSVIAHSAEHYGQLVVYYRVNGLVPPASRPKAK
jgi:uncharacterized damage-inducible protein DinB